MIRRDRRTALRAAALALAGALVGVLGFAAPASAHVTVNPKEAVQGSYGRLAFRVPTEHDTASTVKVEVVLPENAPVTSVMTMPVPGWTVALEKRKLDKPLDSHGTPITEVVSKITWTATGDAAIKPGQFQEFPVSIGPLPETEQMVFKALQTYSDNSVVRWIEEASGTEKPEKPAPVLKLTPAASASASPAPAAVPAAMDSDDGDDDNSTAFGLGVAGLVAGLAGLLLGGLAFARTRRSAA
ncbi:MAG TPA: YcnI family protein [Micromonospora sp.]